MTPQVFIDKMQIAWKQEATEMNLHPSERRLARQGFYRAALRALSLMQGELPEKVITEEIPRSWYRAAVGGSDHDVPREVL